MERMVSVGAAEPVVQGSPTSSAMRTCAYAGLAVLLVAAGWLRFNDQIAQVAPALAAPATLTSQTADDLGIRALVELPLVSQEAAVAEVAQMNLPAAEAALLVQALQRRQVRLVQMPVIDASDLPPAGAAREVEVSAGGYSTVVRLGRQPVSVILPIGPVGDVSFRTFSQDGISIGALGLSGPVRLPPIRPGQVLGVGVIAQ